MICLAHSNVFFSLFKRAVCDLQVSDTQNSVCPNATLALPKWLRLGIAQTSLALCLSLTGVDSHEALNVK